MLGDTTTFRPRNGKSAEAYWRIRVWCENNGFTFSDVLNALMLPVAYYLENNCVVDAARNKADVILNIGKLEILHVVNGKCYPLASTLPEGNKSVLTLEAMQKRVDEWKQKNSERPTEYDLLQHHAKT